MYLYITVLLLLLLLSVFIVIIVIIVIIELDSSAISNMMWSPYLLPEASIGDISYWLKSQGILIQL